MEDLVFEDLNGFEFVYGLYNRVSPIFENQTSE